MKDKMPVLTRRDFIRGTIGVTLGASVFGLQWPWGEARAAGTSLVTIVRDKNAMDPAENAGRDIDPGYRSEEYKGCLVKPCQTERCDRPGAHRSSESNA